mgnify:CR=1 FL=1
MGRLTFIAILFCLVYSPCAKAWVKYNIDAKTIKQVLLNTSMQEGVELLHNQQVDTIRKRQNRLMALTTTLATQKELYMRSMENAEGFGAESGIYRSIVRSSINIANNSALAVKAVMKTNLTGKAIVITRIGGIVTEAAHLGNLFFNIVNNARLSNPLIGTLTGAESPKKDNLNLLNRYERLKMAMDIAIELKKIDRQMTMLLYYCRYNSLSDLLMHMDRETWVNYIYANFTSKHLIEQWNSLVN